MSTGSKLTQTTSAMNNNADSIAMQWRRNEANSDLSSLNSRPIEAHQHNQPNHHNQHSQHNQYNLTVIPSSQWWLQYKTTASWRLNNLTNQNQSSSVGGNQSLKFKF